MDIVVNGTNVAVDEGTTVKSLLETRSITGGSVAVEVNLEIISSEKRSEFVLSEGDVVEVLHF